MELILLFLLNALFSALVLWIAGRFLRIELFFKTAFLIAAAASLVSLIPGVGWILSIIVLFYLLNQDTQAPVWPDLILMVLLSKLVSFVLGAMILSLFS